MDRKRVYFDIETAALPLPYLEMTMPEFTAPANLKDPVKIAAAIEEKKKAYLDDAALSPLTGKVLVIGILDPDGFKYSSAGSEKLTLEFFWDLCDQVLPHCHQLISFNGNGFDLPFLIRRSWHHKLAPSRHLRDGRYWNRDVIDLREVWQLGDRQAPGSLDTISKFFGGTGKTGNGKEFAALWETDRTAALAYLENDLKQTRALAEVML